MKQNDSYLLQPIWLKTLLFCHSNFLLLIGLRDLKTNRRHSDDRKPSDGQIR